MTNCDTMPPQNMSIQVLLTSQLDGGDSNTNSSLSDSSREPNIFKSGSRSLYGKKKTRCTKYAIDRKLHIECNANNGATSN
mmetsp:Transcript_31927/g.38071  ORF Transcript_31927/g.38071 Transcript_31927/m.38071 type:complete len:81 (+) Transcript_31927:61-303(+)